MPRTIALLLASILFALPNGARAATTHLGVAPDQLVTLDLSVRVDPSTGALTQDLGTYQNGTWSWTRGAKGYEVPKGRTLVITDVQAWAYHEPTGGIPSAVELQLEHPAHGYSGSAALFSFQDLPAGGAEVKRQDWTGGVAVPQGMLLRPWAQLWFPASMLSMVRLLVQGYLL